jgi:hypothetical protein
MKFVERIRALFGPRARTRDEVTVRRVTAQDSPFGVEIWDCSAFTQSMISATANPDLAASFTSLRASNGTEYREKTVANPQAHDCELRYEYHGAVQDGVVFKAQEMEDKWDIYLYRPCLYFTRSWSGQLEYRATLSFEPAAVRVTEVESPSGQDPEFARRVVDYLIRSHLLGLTVPHPLPASLPPAAEQIAAYSFSMYGRRCWFGCYSDTSVVPPA